MPNQQISTSGKTFFGNMTAWGALSTAFDGNTSQGATSGVGTSGSPANCYIGVDWGSGNTHTVTEFKLWGPNNGDAVGGGGTGTYELYGSNSSPANSTDGTQLKSATVFPTGANATVDATTGITTTTAYRYHWIRLVLDSGNNGFLAEVEFWEAAVTAYTLTAAAGSYTLSGIAAALNAGKTLVADVGAYVLTGIAVAFPVALSMAAAVGTYVYTGVAAIVGRSIFLTAAAGSYTYTGVAAAFVQALKVAADVGTYTYSGVAAGVVIARSMAAATGTYVLTGFAAALRFGLSIQAATGTYVLSGTTIVMARLVAPARKFKNRVTQAVLRKTRAVSAVLRKTRTTTPTLED